MSKRNFILLIIILIVIVAIILGFFYFSKTTPPGTSTPDTNFFSQFNPFGNNTPKPPTTTTPPVNVSGYTPPVTEVANVKLKKVSSMPIAGFAVFSEERLKAVPIVTPATPATDNTTTPGTAPTAAPAVPAPKTSAKTTKPTPPLTEFMPALRYVARATGNIYETFADQISERQFSATIIPKIYEAFFGNNAQSVVMRYLKTDNKTIETFVSTLPKEYLGADLTVPNEITGSFLPEDIKDVSLSSDTSSIFYLFNVGDNMVGTTLNLLTNKKSQIFSSPFTEWLPDWSNSKMITLTTKPASGIPGYIYSINPSKSSNPTSIFGNINGLTTQISPNGKLILYGDDSLSLYVYHLDTKVSDLLGVKTLPEKCVWGKLSDTVYCAVPKSIDSGLYPDSWYQGETSFSDQIWKIDLPTGNATMLVDPITVSGGEEIDGIKLALDDGENYLFFVNKKDSFLWEFALK